MTAAPDYLTPQQGLVDAVCAAFGWDYQIKAGHAASWAKRLRTLKGLSVVEFAETFNLRYGRVDPGAGEWWVYREVYPCEKLGKFPTPNLVNDSWGRWSLPTAVQLPTSKYSGALDFLARLEADDGKQS